MKKYIVFLLFTGSVMIARAQYTGTKKANTVFTENNLSVIKQKRMDNGDVFLTTSALGYKLFATYANAKLTGYYAIDIKGRKLPATSFQKRTNTSARTLKCFTCVRVVDTDTGKSAEECTEIPCPTAETGEKATSKSAQ